MSNETKKATNSPKTARTGVTNAPASRRRSPTPAPTVVHQNNPWPWIVGLVLFHTLCLVTLVGLYLYLFEDKLLSLINRPPVVLTTPPPVVAIPPNPTTQSVSNPGPAAPAPPPTPRKCETLDYGSFEVYTVPNNYEPKVDGLYVVQDNEIAAVWWGVKKINNESFDLSKAGNYRGYWFGPGEYFLEGNGRFRKWRDVPPQCYQALKNWWQSMPELSGSNPPYLWEDINLP